MKVVTFRVEDASPRVEVIDGSLAGMQAVVGGYIETVRVDADSALVIVCNEEGKIMGLPVNRRHKDNVFCGNIFVTAANEEGSFVSLTDEQVTEAMRLCRRGAAGGGGIPQWVLEL